MAGVRHLHLVRDGETEPKPQIVLPPELLLVTDRLNDAGQTSLANEIVDRFTNLQVLLLVADSIINRPDTPA